jgi:putative serine protease PepD
MEIYRTLPRMGRLSFIGIFLVIGGLEISAAQDVPKNLLPEESNTIQVFKDASRGVVHINARLTISSPFETHSADESTGTGFVIDKQGRIVTAFHVIKDRDEITVILPTRNRYDARLIGTAPQLDIALLQIDAPEADLYPLTLGTSENLQPGQKVLAIGNALGLHNTLSVGVISAVQRTMDDSALELADAVIQTDAAINPGNSGGPLLDSSGEVVGINDAIIRGAQNIGFAIPIDLARTVIPDLIEMGHAYRPMLGFSGSELSPGVAKLFGIPIERGFLIEEVLPNSPASIAGLRSGKRVVVVGQKPYTIGGDIIVAINNVAVNSSADIAKALLHSRPGERLTLRIYRQGKTLDVRLPLLAMDMQF